MINGGQLNGQQLNGSSSSLQELVGTLEDTSAAVEAVHEPDTRHVVSVGGGSDSAQINYAIQTYEEAGASSSMQLFYNPKPDVVISCEGRDNVVAAQVAKPVLSGESDMTSSVVMAIPAWLSARGAADLQIIAYLMAAPVLQADARDSSKAADAVRLTDSAEGGEEYALALGTQVNEVANAELVEELTLQVEIEEQLLGAAADSVEALAHYTQTVSDLAGAFVTFKVSGELVQGWVMNLEGANPVSEYRGYDFNSFARIGRTYFAASDSGVYKLGGDTDDGDQIDAHVRTMMLDFGTTALKRVVAAYLGYTASGAMVLKVRSVDEGRLVEHWYEATEVKAEAPRENFRPLGRGLRSRYWQFELANVDGADFEVTELQLQPIVLKRRV